MMALNVFQFDIYIQWNLYVIINYIIVQITFILKINKWMHWKLYVVSEMITPDSKIFISGIVWSLRWLLQTLKYSSQALCGLWDDYSRRYNIHLRHCVVSEMTTPDAKIFISGFMWSLRWLLQTLKYSSQALCGLWDDYSRRYNIHLGHCVVSEMITPDATIFISGFVWSLRWLLQTLQYSSRALCGLWDDYSRRYNIHLGHCVVSEMITPDATIFISGIVWSLRWLLLG